MPSSVNLGAKLEDVVDDLVKNGRFGSRSEVLREGVRLVHDREEWLRLVTAKVEAGRADVAAGRVHDAEEVFAELTERYRNWPA